MSSLIMYPSNHDRIISINDSLSLIDNIEYNQRTLFKPLKLHANDLEEMGNYVKVMEMYTLYLAILQKLVGRDNSLVSETLHIVGVIHWKVGEYNDALNVLFGSFLSSNIRKVIK